jgi:hypothetical protein
MIEDMENNPYQSDSDVEEYYQTAISNLSKHKINVYHQLSRDRIGDIDLEYLRTGFEGLEYRRFIKILFQITSCDDLLTGISGNFSALNPVEREAAKAILKLYDQYALDRNFWRKDCDKVLHEISESFEQILTAEGCQIEDKIKFIMFQLVSDNFAVIALHDKELRKIAGIRKGLFYRWRKLFCFCGPFPENANYPHFFGHT